MNRELEKRNAARAALNFVEDGMTIGLGTGSTARHFIELLAEEIKEGLIIRAVPTSEETRDLAIEHHISLIDIEQVQQIHLTVDGADEANEVGDLIKGGGGALLREKLIANASDHMVVIADPSKYVSTLGAFPLPVEVIPFGFTLTAKKIFDVLEQNGIARPKVELRQDEGEEGPFITDGGHYILDCHCSKIPDAPKLASQLCAVPGVVEHGLFISMARTLIIGGEDGATIFEF